MQIEHARNHEFNGMDVGTHKERVLILDMAEGLA